MAHNHILPRLATQLSVDANGTPILFRQIQPLSASVGANALTVTLAPTLLEFRSTTATVGIPNVRVVPSAISLTVPNGATLGTTSNLPARLVVLAIDNNGTVELAITNARGDNNYDETLLASTSAIQSGSNGIGTWYSISARVGVPFRVVGFIDITQATAGAWSSSPTLVQGTGGQNFTSIPTYAMAGQVAYFAMNFAPPGWLKANGAAISRTTYSNLYSRLGTAFGAGNGSTTFNVPDLRGEFLRCWDDGRGLDAGRGFGDVQGGQNLSHDHSGYTDGQGDHNHFNSVWTNLLRPPYGGSLTGSDYTGSGSEQAVGPGDSQPMVNAGFHSHNVYVYASGGGEARPRNVSLLACIKY